MDPEAELISADPVVVEHIVSNITSAISECIIPNVTTQADVLSAVFTVLQRILRGMQQETDPADQKANARELGRVLTGMLLEFGDSGPLN